MKSKYVGIGLIICIMMFIPIIIFGWDSIRGNHAGMTIAAIKSLAIDEYPDIHKFQDTIIDGSGGNPLWDFPNIGVIHSDFGVRPLVKR